VNRPSSESSPIRLAGPAVCGKSRACLVSPVFPPSQLLAASCVLRPTSSDFQSTVLHAHRRRNGSCVRIFGVASGGLRRLERTVKQRHFTLILSLCEVSAIFKAKSPFVSSTFFCGGLPGLLPNDLTTYFHRTSEGGARRPRKPELKFR
jgi:hypothetical protein